VNVQSRPEYSEITN